MPIVYFPIFTVLLILRRGEEIDLAVRDPGVSTTFIEVKWSRVGEMEARRIARDLRRKAALSG